MHSDKVNGCIEALCANGCDAVRASIENLEHQISPTQTCDLSEIEVKAVLRELKSIMAVYDERSCQCCSQDLSLAQKS
jgi:hypothetical protein